MGIESRFGKIRKMAAAVMMGTAAASGAPDTKAQTPPSGEALIEGRFFWRFNNENTRAFINTNSVVMTMAAHGANQRTVMVDDDRGRRIGTIRIGWPITDSSYGDFESKVKMLLRANGYMSR